MIRQKIQDLFVSTYFLYCMDGTPLNVRSPTMSVHCIVVILEVYSSLLMTEFFLFVSVIPVYLITLKKSIPSKSFGETSPLFTYNLQYFFL